MKIFGLAGWSGSGKTTLLERLIPTLTTRGITVSTIKHAHHSFDIDSPTKDSFKHRHAGATEVMVSSVHRWALMHELRGEEEPSLEDLIKAMAPVDLLLIEGFKYDGHDRLEVYRPSIGKPLLAKDNPRIVAIASDGPVQEAPCPVIDLNDIGKLADFVVNHCQLPVDERGAA